VYALAGLGLVLTYKTSGVFNFALGALATVGAYVFYVLYVLNHWAWPLAAVVAILVAGPVMGLLLELLARRIQTTGLALRVASTVGLLLVIVAAIQLIYGTEQVRQVPIFLGTRNLRMFGTNVQLTQLVTFLFALAATGVLTVVFRYSRSGITRSFLISRGPRRRALAGWRGSSARCWWRPQACCSRRSSSLIRCN
jgi:branched-subunit amino acid ABC-type transport system permease component